MKGHMEGQAKGRGLIQQAVRVDLNSGRIYIICTPNLGFEITVLGLEGEYSRFKRRQQGTIEKAWGEHRGSIGGSKRA